VAGNGSAKPQENFHRRVLGGAQARPEGKPRGAASPLLGSGAHLRPEGECRRLARDYEELPRPP